MSTHRRASEGGQALAEYALILVLVAVVVIVIVGLTGQAIGQIFCDVIIKLGGTGSPIPACAAPRVTISGIAGGSTVSGNIAVEAIINDDKGNTGPNITNVKFYMDNNPPVTENVSKYCLGGGDNPCNAYNFSGLGAGPHKLRVVATDIDGNTGETTINFTVA